jgi:hypothetical protein
MDVWPAAPSQFEQETQMRTVLMVALATTAVAVPTAVAHPGNAGGPANHPATATQPVKRPVAFVVRGVVRTVDGTTITIDVTGGNRFARRALADLDPQSFDVATDETTRFSKRGTGMATLADVAKDDRVVVIYTALRSTDTSAELAALTARRVVDIGPTPAPTPKPAS